LDPSFVRGTPRKAPWARQGLLSSLQLMAVLS